MIFFNGYKKKKHELLTIIKKRKITYLGQHIYVKHLIYLLRFTVHRASVALILYYLSNWRCNLILKQRRFISFLYSVYAKMIMTACLNSTDELVTTDRLINVHTWLGNKRYTLSLSPIIFIAQIRVINHSENSRVNIVRYNKLKNWITREKSSTTGVVYYIHTR